MQKRLAEEVTILVHGQEGLQKAQYTTELLFKGTKEQIMALSEAEILDIFDGVNQFALSIVDLSEGLDIVSFAGDKTKIFPSKGEARKMIQGGGVSINKTKLSDPNQKPEFQLLLNKYLLAQKGKKNYYLIIVE